MIKLIMYLFESSVVLALLYLLYILVLRRETFFSINRFFLMGIMAFSLFFPFLSFNLVPSKVVAVDRPLVEINKIRLTYYEAMASWEYERFRATDNLTGPEKSTLPPDSSLARNLLWFLTALYAMGIVFCLSKLFWTFRWLWTMISHYPREKVNGINVIKLPHASTPFSFLKYVFIHDAIVNTPEFDQIIAHEKTHINQRHSIDLIFVQLLAAFYWFNPVVWRLIKSLKTNHEYIADKKIIDSGYSLVEYQTLLLRQLISNNSYGLVHNFNLSFIKKRITMMKNKKSGWSGKVKVALALLCTVIFSVTIIQCNSKIEEQVLVVSEKSTSVSNDIKLPVLPQTSDVFEGDLSKAITIEIVDNKLTLNGESHTLGEIVPWIEKNGYSDEVVVVMRIDGDQSMDFVGEVQMELRKANKRKILYLGQTNNGAKVETSLLLPPTPENAALHGLVLQPDIAQMEANGSIDVLKINMGDNSETVSRKKVYDFVKGHLEKQSTGYVVSAKFEDKDTYNKYLATLVNIKKGFDDIYQERAQKMFGKNFYDTDKEEYKAVRTGVPMAISISD